MTGNGKKSKRKRKVNPCDKAWADKEAEYLNKNKAQEWKVEKELYYCNGTEVIPRPTDEGDRPLTDKEISAGKKKGSVYATSKDHFKNRPKKKKK